MGGVPITALNILSYPFDLLDQETVNNIILGALQKTREAGAIIIGGHTTDNNEVVFGLSVTGVVSPKDLIRNSTAKVGDVLILTKPIGATLIATNISRGSKHIDNKHLNLAIEVMCLLNKTAIEIGKIVSIHACTDVTGFGLLGHLWEMCSASNVAVHLQIEKIPTLPEAIRLINLGIQSSALARNKEYLLKTNAVEWTNKKRDHSYDLFFEGETSGGLLISISPNKVGEFIRKLNKKQNFEFVQEIGRIIEGAPKIYIE